ncbi:flavodoxin family protein [Luteolibacter arcticus]|uniref:Flavodoxin family protein n=1 Tax=Luteolibacter arcticus TaxID=1581411 RepID=A0ABT3GHV3_9BACT|nr:flavodoxin family protein [Luteolibacter arcticus]MCW1923083.1 flavodoxin family protein [Luteolibacter arcticus]
MESPSSPSPSSPIVRIGQGPLPLPRAEFERRYREQFADPAFEDAKDAVDQVTRIAADAYEERRKTISSRPAGSGFQDPSYELATEWLDARTRIQEAQKEFEDPARSTRVLLISASPRTDESCPGEIAKSFRLAGIARTKLEADGCEVDLLDLSLLTAEYGRRIFPCKACVSTAMPLCHWPCSCYPNHYLGQVQDWMNELYPRWVAAHGIMIITPVHWFQVPSGLKLMIDRLVCADGGNPDPTSTSGKDAAKAKEIELNGWNYPKHLAGRLFSVIVHGDAEGSGGVRRNLHDWLSGIGLVSAGPVAVFDRYIGYFEPYATSHEALDRDAAIQEETRHAATTLVQAVTEMRSGRRPPGDDLPAPRAK